MWPKAANPERLADGGILQKQRIGHKRNFWCLFGARHQTGTKIRGPRSASIWGQIARGLSPVSTVYLMAFNHSRPQIGARHINRGPRSASI
jgi:hypothetical protein